MPEAPRLLVAMGDPHRIDTWSGTPYFFLQAAREQGFLAGALPLRPEGLRHLRLAWHLAQAARGARPGGFQYTEAFLRRLFAKARLCHDRPLEIIRSDERRVGNDCSAR